MKGTGRVLGVGQLGAAKIQPGKHPNCAGGENQSGEYAIVENFCVELKSHSTHVLNATCDVATTPPPPPTGTHFLPLSSSASMSLLQVSALHYLARSQVSEGFW